MREVFAAFALASLLAACGQATAPPEEAPAPAAVVDSSTEARGGPADLATEPADSAEPSTEPGYSPPQD